MHKDDDIYKERMAELRLKRNIPIGVSPRPTIASTNELIREAGELVPGIEDFSPLSLNLEDNRSYFEKNDIFQQ